MSYILDALKRAERERKQGQVSVLDEIPGAAAVEPRRRLPRWLIPAVAAIAVLAGLVFGVVAWRHHPADGAQPPVAVAPPLPQALIAPPASPVAVQPPPPPPPQTPAATIEDGRKLTTLDDVQSPGVMANTAGQAPPRRFGLPRPQIATPDVDPNAPPPAAMADGRDIPAGPPPLPADDTPPPQVAPPPAAVQAPPPDAALQAPPPAQGLGPSTGQHPLQEMPESFRANFPTFTVDVHAYNKDPARRFVLIGGKRYREGDTLAEGPRILGIVPEGIVFEWQGQQVLYAMSR